jgi:hypothetical protein
MNPGELISSCKINGPAMNPGELISGCKINGPAMNPGELINAEILLKVALNTINQPSTMHLHNERK